MELAVSFNLECAHRAAITRQIHGHSYVVTVWFVPDHADADIECHAAAVKMIGAMVDHTQLEDSIGGSTMEDIATWMMVRMSLLASITVTRINVARPTLGYQVELKR